MGNKPIIMLDQATINLIAAGEVVESPASIIKELVENSIDAGSSSIVIEIKDGGKSYIRVTDDGEGIDENSVEIAFQRHTTSKITTYNDFENLHTNGFRGEALGSISAVSKVTLVTKTLENLYGIHMVLVGGELLDKKKTGAKDGTTIIVEDIFFNTPARKKFLKTNQAETSKISDIIIHLALANPNIKFKYINNNKVMLSTLGNNSLLDTINSIHNGEFRNGLLEIDETLRGVTLKGYIGHNTLMYSSRRNQYIFVNSRVVRGKEIVDAIESAYSSFIPSGNFPAFMIDILIPPSIVDVNIHPNKLDIKFGKENNIAEIVEQIIKEKLNNLVMIPQISLVRNKKQPPVQEKIIESISIDHLIENSNPVMDIANIKTNLETPSSILYADPVEVLPEVRETLLQENQVIENKILEENLELLEYQSYTVDFDHRQAIFIGIIFDTYFIAQYHSSIFLIDQHAAHERILYEKYLNSVINCEYNTQNLLIPINIKFPLTLSGLEEEVIDYLENKGFVAELFGENNIAVRGIPNIFSMEQGRLFVDEVINLKTQNIKKAVILDNKIAMQACKAAIKAHDKLDPSEIHSILSDLSLCKNKYTCPHGRPVIVELSKYEIEKMFKRVLK